MTLLIPVVGLLCTTLVLLLWYPKPTRTGKLADLYTVEFLNNDYTSSPVITKVANRHFYCKDNQGNFDAAAGIYTDENGNMGIYSAHFYIENNFVYSGESGQ